MAQKLSSFWMFFLDRSRVTILFTALFLLLGITAYKSMPQENAPDVEIPIVIVTTVWPGATAQDVENLITEHIENEVKTLENLKEYTSTSSAGISNVVIEFEIGVDMIEKTNKVKDVVDDAAFKLPESLPDEPQVIEANISSTPILSLSLSGDYAYSQLKDFAESLGDEIETLSGVKEARLSGVPDEAYHFYIDPLALQGLGLSLDEVLQTISLNHRDLPLGNISVRGETVEVRVEGEIDSVQDFTNLPIKGVGASVIRLSDIGEIRREFDELKVEKFISTGDSAQRLVSLDILKAETKTNIPKTVEQIFTIIERLKTDQQLPKNLKVDVIFNSAEDIEKSLGELFVSGFQTLAVIMIVLLIALGWRESILAFIAVPLTLLIAILGLYLIGETFNFMSLFALVLALGLLVDNAIIITEGVSEGIFAHKKSPKEAAIEALRDFRWPVITGTMTTMLAFAPMLFMISGVSGEFISGIPKTVIFVLSASLFVSLFMLPTYGALFFEIFKPKAARQGKIMKKAKQVYRQWMEWILSKARNRYIVLLGSFVTMFFAFSLVITGKVSVEIFPSDDENYFVAAVEAPQGTDLETMKAYLPDIDQVFSGYFEEPESWLKNYQISFGERSAYDPENDGRSGSIGDTGNLIGITINLIDKSERNISSKKLAPRVSKDLREALPGFLDVTISELAAGPPGGDQPIKLEIVSDNFNRVENLKILVVEGFESFELPDGSRLKNITDDQGDMVSQMRWKFDRDRLNRYGLTPSSLRSTLRAGLEGVRVLEITEEGEEIDVEARFDFEGTRRWEDPESLDILNQIPIKTPTGNYITLADVADFEMVVQPTQFKHLDGKRTVSVGAAIEGAATAAQFTAQIQDLIDSLPLEPGDQINIGGDNEDSQRLIKEMSLSMLLAVFLILFILVLQFNSFSQAGVIVWLLPLSLTGVFIGFWISKTPISFPAMIGIVALAGIIVNDAIVLIDQINKNTAKHQENNHREEAQRKAFIDAGASRMQPIFLTSITTIFGLLPLALSAPIWEGLGFAIIYGMILATFLTVILVPCLILASQDLNRGFVWLITWPVRVFKK